MNLLPVAMRELRLLARRRRTYRIRIYTALGVTVLSLGMLYAGFGGWLSAASAGRTLFVVLSAVAAIYVLFEGAILTADCLSEEKRNGTLGLLFLTDLKGYDVVAGKLISQTANSAFALMAALPTLAIALFLGGVTGQEIWFMSCALLNGLFFAGSFGLLVSACSRHERRALSLAVVGVLAWSTLLPLAGWGLEVWLQGDSIHPLFLLGSPATTFLGAAPSLAGGAFPFTASLLCTHLLAWTFLLAASLVLPTTVREKTGSMGVRQAAAKLRVASRPPAATFIAGDPLLRAGDRPGQRGLGIWPVLAVFALTWAGGWAMAHQQWLTLPVYAGTAVLLHVSLCYFVTLHACRALNEDQRTGMLELLLTTPLGDDVYLGGRMLSLKRQCVGPLLCVLAADIALLVAAWCDSGIASWEVLAWLGIFALLVVRLLVDLYTLAWVGLWQALTVGDTGRAIRRTFFYVFIVRWMAPVALLAMLGVLTTGRSFQTPATPILAALGYILMPLISMQYLAQARSELQDDLRALALDHTGAERRPRWSLLLGLSKAASGA